MLETSARQLAYWLAPALGLCACLGPNPRLDMGEQSETAAPETSGDGDGDGTSEVGDGDGDGDGDAETTGPMPNCDNDMLDGDETDVDCGGSCSPCADGLACVEPGDCASGVCADGSCAAPTCDDEVQNNGETGIDCGGPCTFCTLTDLLPELDDYEGSSATHPHVEYYSDASFAVSYRGPMQARARWFDAVGEPLGSDLELSDELSPAAISEPIYFAADDDPASEQLHALVAGTDMMSQNTDLFLVRRDPSDQLHRARVNTANTIVEQGDLLIDGERATLAWNDSGEILVRRYDYGLGDGNWSDISPFEPETAPDVVGSNPYLARSPTGVVAVIWVRCTQMGPPCEVVTRRFDAGEWLDPEPVVVSTDMPAYFTYPKIALAADGRAMAAWYRVDIGVADCQARVLDDSFTPEGAQWTVQADLPAGEHVGLVALADESFALAWPDPDQSTVHLSRYVGANTLKNPDIGEEAPWSNINQPRTVSAAALDDRLVVVWSATVDMVAQVQGQILGY